MSNNKSGAVIIEGHVQGLSNTRALGEAGIPVYVIDKTNCIARYSKYCQKYFRCPDFQGDDFAEFLIDLAEKENIQGWILIPSNDHAVYTISKHKPRLKQYYKIITPDLDIIENIYDKGNLLNLAEKNNVPIPETRFLNSKHDQINTQLDYPIIVKGRRGLSFYKVFGKKVLLADNKEQLDAHLEVVDSSYKINDVFIQELIPYDCTNNTVSFTAFCVDGEVKIFWMGEKLREHPIRFGTATFAKSIYIEDCLMLSKPLLKALHYTGVCEIEYLLDPRDNKYKLIEINARTWLWVGLARACGIDYALLIYKYLNGDYPEYPIDYKLNLKWRNTFTDTFFGMMGIIKGNYKIKDYANSLRGEVIDAVWKKDDMRPAFAMAVMLIYIARTR